MAAAFRSNHKRAAGDLANVPKVGQENGFRRRDLGFDAALQVLKRKCGRKLISFQVSGLFSLACTQAEPSVTENAVSNLKKRCTRRD